MRSGVPAAAWAEQQVTSVRDHPGGRIALMERCYHGPFGKAPRHLRFRRAAMSFMRWQLRRGVRLVDYGVIVPRLQQLYEWSAHELAAPGLLDFVRDGAMTYAWPIQDRAPTIHPLKGTEGQHEPFRRTVGGLVGAG